MPAPAKSFTVIADTKIDADSPTTEELMTWIRDNAEHLEEWLGKNYTAAVDHDHDGVNSKLVSVGASMKFLTPEVSKASGTGQGTYLDVDISADTGADTAKMAILAVDVKGGGAGRKIFFRKNGSSTDDQTFKFDSAEHTFQVIVPVDSAEIFEFKTTGSISAHAIRLQGYIL